MDGGPDARDDEKRHEDVAKRCPDGFDGVHSYTLPRGDAYVDIVHSSCVLVEGPLTVRCRMALVCQYAARHGLVEVSHGPHRLAGNRVRQIDDPDDSVGLVERE